jgi:Uma2 family endonuclease
MTITDIRLWTVDEYHRMIEAEILTHEDKVELLAGQIIQMSPQQPPHAATTQWASDYLRELLGTQVTIRVQLPITLHPNSEPEPDIAIVRINPRRYLGHHPTSDDIFLVVEVADATLAIDCKQKAQTYAKAKIADYWVLDVQKRQVYVFRQPENESYQQQIVLDENSIISPLAFSEIEVKINQFFP